MSQQFESKAHEEFYADCIKAHGKLLTGKFAHWCWDWDSLPVDETTPEWEGCTCYSGEPV